MEANFESRNERAFLEIAAEYLPNYNEDPATALNQLAEDYGGTYTSTDLIGQKWTVTVSHSEQITRQGDTILRQRMTMKPEYAFLYCSMTVDRMIILARSWTTAQRAIFVVASRCQDETREQDNLKRAFESFALIPPY